MMNRIMKGIVIWWNRKKGYGIADVLGDNKQILLYHTQIKKVRTRGKEYYLRGGDLIVFDTHRVNPNIAKNIIWDEAATVHATEKTQGAQLYDDSTDEEEY